MKYLPIIGMYYYYYKVKELPISDSNKFEMLTIYNAINLSGTLLLTITILAIWK